MTDDSERTVSLPDLTRSCPSPDEPCLAGWVRRLRSRPRARSVAARAVRVLITRHLTRRSSSKVTMLPSGAHNRLSEGGELNHSSA
jgi:hypothetical protein